MFKVEDKLIIRVDNKNILTHSIKVQYSNIEMHLTKEKKNEKTKKNN